MAEDHDVLMNLNPGDAMRASEIHALRQVADAISLQGRQVLLHMEANTKAMERLSGRIDGMSERLVKLEAQKHGLEIEKVNAAMAGLAQRIDNLESTRDQQKGAKAFVDWVRQTAPWLVAASLGWLAFFGIRPST